MSDDFYLQSGRRQLQALQAERAAALADLESHKLNGDAESAAGTIQNLAGIDAQMRDLTALYNQYAASQAPPPEPSIEERRSRPLDKMTYADVYDMLRHSKYGVDDNAFAEGVREVARRRARGE